MTPSACRVLHRDIDRFIEFKRTLGYKYVRNQLALRSFERFALACAKQQRTIRMDRAMMAWVSRVSGRKTQTVAFDIGVLRQFCAYLRRTARAAVREPVWPQLPAAPAFLPYILSTADIKNLMRRAAMLGRPRFRGRLFRTLILLLYCTGLRFGEALHLRLGDVDLRSGVLLIAQFKGRSRLVPMHRSVVRELKRYLVARRAFARAGSGDALFLGLHGRPLQAKAASETIRRLLRAADLKTQSGRVGPRPYDLRHTFAVHRLTRWYHAGADLHARLPWLSAYMGHDDILGTETYLTSTPELLSLAAHRFHRRYLKETQS